MSNSQGTLTVSPRPASLCLRNVLIAVGFSLLALAGCSSRRNGKLPPPTAEETAYLPNIQITGARVTAAENFLQHTVVTLHARITNKGNRTVRYLEVSVDFSNYSGQTDLHKQKEPINPNTPALKPGETQTVKLSFDQPPEDWNQAPPKITPVRVVLANSR